MFRFLRAVAAMPGPQTIANREVLPAAGVSNRAISTAKIKFEEAAATHPHLKLTWLENDSAINTLGGIRLTGVMLEQNETSPYWVVFYCGNTEFAQRKQEDMLTDATMLGVNTICVNYRGVAGSDGQAPTKEEFISDASAVVDYLTTVRGVPSSHIILKGQSLGGAAATWVAAKYHEKRQPIYLASLRSFWKMYEIDALDNGDGFLNKLGTFILRAGVFSFWDMRVDEAWGKIPTDYAFVLVVEGDEVIGDQLKSFIDLAKKSLQEKRSYHDGVISTPHSRGKAEVEQSKLELKKIIWQLHAIENAKALQHVPSSKDSREGGAHNAPLHDLSIERTWPDKELVDGNQLFFEFAIEAFKLDKAVIFERYREHKKTLTPAVSAADDSSSSSSASCSSSSSASAPYCG